MKVDVLLMKHGHFPYSWITRGETGDDSPGKIHRGFRRHDQDNGQHLHGNGWYLFTSLYIYMCV